MNYISIINLIFLIIGGIFALYLFHFIFFAISGIVHKKKYPSRIERCRYAAVISCKDEENVIARLIKNLKEADYPIDKLDIYVIAHNCSDNTAKVAEANGAKVIIYNNKEANAVGYAYEYFFDNLKDISSYDGFFIFDADNKVKKDFFIKMNDAFLYYDKKDIINSFRSALNFDKGVMPACYGLYFATGCLLAFNGRNNFNVSGRISGCGFVIPSYILEKGWHYKSLTEDVEFSVDNVLNGSKIHYCHEATFYDEQPLRFKAMWVQRLRWSKGLLDVSRKYFFKLLFGLFNKNKKNKVSMYTFLTFHSFLSYAGFTIFILPYILMLFAPLTGISLETAFLYWDHNASWFYNMFLSLNTGALFFLARALVFGLIFLYLMGTATLVASYDKYKNNKKSILFLSWLVFPLFIMLQLPLDIVALFSKDLKWNKTKHGE